MDKSWFWETGPFPTSPLPPASDGKGAKFLEANKYTSNHTEAFSFPAKHTIFCRVTLTPTHPLSPNTTNMPHIPSVAKPSQACPYIIQSPIQTDSEPTELSKHHHGACPGKAGSPPGHTLSHQRNTDGQKGRLVCLSTWQETFLLQALARYVL